MNPVPILSEHLSWSSTIGNFIINFGTLDQCVFIFLKDRLTPEQFAKVKELHFKDRLNRMGQLMQEGKFPADQQKEFTQLFARLEPIRELRNHIAHGHMYARLDEKTKEWVVTLFKAKDLDTGLMPDAKHVEFAELLAALQTLNELIEGFQRLAGFKTEAHASS